jgi:hypothetical protein
LVTGDIFPTPGDHVLVPWGLEEVLGEVVEIYSTGLGDRAVVRVLDSGDPDATVTVPADSLRRIGGISSGISARMDAVAYEGNVISAIQRVIRELGLNIRKADRSDGWADAILTDGRGRQVAVQAKFFSSGRVPSDTISVVAGYASSVGPIILVTNGDPTSAASKHLSQLRRRKIPAWHARWNNTSDDIELGSVIRSAMAT